MELRDRSQLRGTVKSVTKGDVFAEVVVDIGGQEVVSLVSASSVETLGLAAGASVAAIVKSTEIVIGK
jgi:molybdate transport system regulatory protein